MRNTEQRRVLVEYVFSQHDHFDADALIEKLPRKGEPGYVSRPTVYRTLNEFVDAGLVAQIRTGGTSGLRTRLRLSAARSSLLPELPEADRVSE